MWRRRREPRWLLKSASSSPQQLIPSAGEPFIINDTMKVVRLPSGPLACVYAVDAARERKTSQVVVRTALVFFAHTPARFTRTVFRKTRRWPCSMHVSDAFRFHLVRDDVQLPSPSAMPANDLGLGRTRSQVRPDDPGGVRDAAATE